MQSSRNHRANPVPAAVGIGLRAPHIADVLRRRPAVPFFEVHSENLFCAGGPMWDAFTQVRRDYQVSLHGVGLSVGSADGIDAIHLRRLREVVDRAEPALVSEHVSWGAISGRHFNDLLPLPYTEEALAVMIAHVTQMQEGLNRQVLLENVSSYIHYTHSTMPEWEFLTALARRSGCMLLVDVNNVYVNSVNHGIDARRYLASIPPELVGEIHLAGFTRKEDAGGPLLIDTHDHRVAAEVWQLYGEAIAHFGAIPTLIEWDQDLPAFDVLQDEARIATEYLHAHAVQLV
jgi:uncharacterized protein (UPF0276 family)